MMWYFSVCLFYISFTLLVANLEVTGIENNYKFNFNLINYETYTKDNPQKEVKWQDVNFNDGMETKFVIHGYLTKTFEEEVQVKDVTFETEQDVGRVVIVDWRKVNGIVGIDYWIVAKYIVPKIAEDLTKTLIYVQNKGTGKILLVGHSLGAHIAGQASRLLEREIGKKIDSIIGLDPAGTWFKELKNQDKAIKCTDAKKVEVIHTDTARYGYPYKICPDDLFPNGGKKQPECYKMRLDDICSHMHAWDRYLEQMENETVIEYPESQRYVLCLDISLSMKDNNDRLDRVQGSAKQVIESMPIGSYLGIVSFGGKVEISHPIVQIKGKKERESLISSIPSEAIEATCIKAGLETSKDMLKQSIGNDKLRSSINLITDGKEECPESISVSDVIPELVKAGIRVNSVGLGSSASNELENLADKTGGEVFYVVEGSSSKMISDTFKALFYSFESRLDPDSRPIALPSKEIFLSGDPISAPFIMDKDIGKDTAFSIISNHIQNIHPTLISPQGLIYNSSSSEYSYDPISKVIKFNFDNVESGSWNVNLRETDRRKRVARSADSSSVIISAKTHPKSEKVDPIRLEATLSSRSLVYPKPINVYAGVRVGYFPVIQASVEARIEGLNQKMVSFQLRDDGAFPDKLGNDGIYSGSIIKLLEPERYSISVKASSNGTAMLIKSKTDYFNLKEIDCGKIRCENMYAFERETQVGSIKLVSKDNENLITINAVTDLKVVSVSEKDRRVALQWTVPGSQVFGVKVKYYDLRVYTNGSLFEEQFQFFEHDLIEGSLNSGNSSAGEKKKIVLHILQNIWDIGKENAINSHHKLSLTFVMKSIGETNESDLSNPATAVIIKSDKDGGLMLRPLNIFTLSVISYSVYYIVYLHTFIN